MRPVPAALLALALAVVASRPATGQVPAWRLTERWSVDGTEGDGDGFGQVRSAVVAKDGTLWVLDFADQSIRRYGADGRYLGTTGRKGAGPGEMRNANGLLAHPDGTVWVNDPSNGRFTVFAPDGAFARQHVLPIRGYMYQWAAWVDVTANDVVEQSILPNEDGNGFGLAWRRIGADGRDRGRVSSPSCPTPGQSPFGGAGWEASFADGRQRMSAYPFTTGGGLAADGRGAYWCASPAARRVVRVAIASGDTLATSAIDLPLPVVSDAERRAAIADVERQLAGAAKHTFEPSRVPRVKPSIESLSVDAEGRLWVKHAPTFGVTRTVFDVHAPGGAHLGRVTVPARVPYGMAPIAQGDRLWLTLLDEDELVRIVRYDVVR